MNFIEFMKEEKSVSRWFVLRIATIGAFAGALLATVWLIVGFRV